ncbi:putative quinol monooxygenase [Pedobacter antarcticus]|uniref:putative quinol monooxygenase n=1 Tax=Pedobacter antarcticus TaxID=34086 RepID=UPI001C592AE3|nr:putative quinol monooxygenase [Pedobacter antarcticus]
MKISCKWSAGLILSLLSFNLQAQETPTLKRLPTTQPSSFSVPPGTVTIVAWTKIKAGSEEKVAKATRIMTDLIRKNEPGNLMFEAHQGVAEGGTIIFYEIFKDKTAFETHKNSVHVKNWFKAIEGLTATSMHVNIVENIDIYTK